MTFFGNSGDKMITQGVNVRRGAAVGFILSAAVLAAHSALAQSTTTTEVPATQVPSAQVPATEVQPAVPALSAEALALRTALEGRLGRDSAALTAYAARNYKPIWLNEDGSTNAAAKVLTEFLSRASEHALPAAKYKGAALTARLGERGPRLEADLTAAFLSYAGDVKTGFLTPRRIDRELHIFPETPDEGFLIERAGRAADMAAFLDELAPSDPLYRRLIERYAAFRSIAGQEIWGPSVSKGRTLRPGNRNSRVAQVRARLTAMGDLDPNVYDQRAADDGTKVAAANVTTDVPVQSFDADLFDDPMVEALQRFQARHGLNLDGVIGPATLRQLNVSPRTRAEQIAVNLERLRWMNRDLGERHILVNLASFTFDVMHNGKSEFHSRAVVGKKKHKTPEFSDEMTHMVINPTWYIPTSIKEKEILPKLANDPNYLVNRNMKMLSSGRLIQKPGRGNALGTVKFMFPNQFAIYLHDTPSKRLFKRDVRAYSHGCVRVERPHEFAEYLLTGQVDDPRGYFNRILKRGRERQVNLDNPLPVHLTYRSAWIDEHGIEQFRGDIYGRDGKIARAMKNAGVSILQ
ncbi:MAG: L,D-transpeptidase family protein [Pseudomonadota bacterium]